jgi:O-antigen/teichoic acid export membrane protein
MNLYPWFLAAFHGTASAGVWAACLGAVALGNPVVLGVQNFLGPKIAHVYAQEGRKSLRRFVLSTSVAVALPLLLFGLAMMLLGGPLVTLLYGHKYAGNGLVVALLAFNLAVSALAFSFSRALFAIERADLDFVVNFVALFIMLTFGLWLVRSFGVAGAAFGLLTANAAASAVRCFVFAKILAAIHIQEVS